MNKSNLWGLIIVALCLIQTNYAQQTISCDEKARRAKQYTDYLSEFSETHKAEILQYITPCATSGHAESQYIAGIIALESVGSGTTDEQAFALVEQAAQNGHTEAERTLGIYYKTGTGRDVDLVKAKFWFDRAAAKGDAIAQFSVGYFEMKGLGSTEQSYTKALQSFTSNSYPMSKHWIGIAHYFGYGVRQEPEAALQLLQQNTIANSDILSTFLIDERNTLPPHITDWERNLINNFETTLETIMPDDIASKFEGKIVELDWKEEQVKRAEDTKFTFDYNPESNSLTYKIEVLGTILEGNATFNDNIVTLENVNFPVKRLYKDSEKANITYHIQDIKFDLSFIEEQKYLVGKINGVITDFKEPTPPLFIILKPTEVVQPPITTAITNVAPNPFTSSIMVNYHLETGGATMLKMYNSNRLEVASVRAGRLPAGDYQKEIGGLGSLSSGLYLVHLVVNNDVKSFFKIVKQ